MSFQQNSKKLEEFEKTIHQPGLYISDYFSDLRNKIDMQRERVLEKIHKRSNEQIELLKKLENECIDKIPNKQYNY